MAGQKSLISAYNSHSADPSVGLFTSLSMFYQTVRVPCSKSTDKSGTMASQRFNDPPTQQRLEQVLDFRFEIWKLQVNKFVLIHVDFPMLTFFSARSHRRSAKIYDATYRHLHCSADRWREEEDAEFTSHFSSNPHSLECYLYFRHRWRGRTTSSSKDDEPPDSGL